MGVPTLITPPEMPEAVVIAVETMGNRARIDILRMLVEAETAMTNLELAERLETNKISVRRHLLELEKQGLVIADLSAKERGSRTVHWRADPERFRQLLERLGAYVLGVYVMSESDSGDAETDE